MPAPAGGPGSTTGNALRGASAVVLMRPSPVKRSNPIHKATWVEQSPWIQLLLHLAHQPDVGAGQPPYESRVLPGGQAAQNHHLTLSRPGKLADFTKHRDGTRPRQARSSVANHHPVAGVC